MPALDPILPLPILLPLWCIAVGMALLWCRRYLPSGERSTYGLLALRVMIFVLVLAICLRPDWQSIEETLEKSRLYMLRDASDSMQTQDMDDGQSRHDAVDTSLKRHANAIQVLHDNFELEMNQFARSIPIQENRTDGTAIGDTMLQISDQAHWAPGFQGCW